MTSARLVPYAAAIATALLLAALYYYGATLSGYWSYSFALDAGITAGALIALAAVLFFITRHAFAVLVLAVALYLAIGVGLAQGVTALLVLASSVLLGRQLLAVIFPAQATEPTAAGACGFAAYLAVFGLMIHFPVNFPFIYFLLFAAPFLIEAFARRLPALQAELTQQIAAARDLAGNLPYASAAATLIGVTLVARLAFMPTLGFDDNALHLGMWSQLRHGAIYEFDYVAQVWEVAPFAVDLLHACVSLVAGNDARGATNLLLLAVLLGQLWVALGSLQVAEPGRLLLLALFVSTPMTGYLLQTMQTELFMAVLATTGVRLVIELRGNWCSPHGAALLAVAALCCATKLTGAVLGVMLLAAMGFRLWSVRGAARRASSRSIALLGGFTLLLALLAFNAYATAWVKTGNPVFPLYNAIFQSPYFEARNFADLRWIKDFSLATYWDLFFNTSEYFDESRNFVAGFQYLLLFPLGAAGLVARQASRPLALTLLVPLFGYALFVFAATQYWRYQFPVFALATVTIGTLLAPGYSARGAVVVRSAVLVCIVANACFYPGISGYFSLAPGAAYTVSGKQRVVEQQVAGRALTQWINANVPGSHVLYPEAIPYGATLNGTPVYVNWYSPSNDAGFHAIRDEAQGLAFLREREIDYVVAWMTDPAPPGSLGWGLRRLMSRTAVPVLQISDHILYRFTDSDVPYAPAYSNEQQHSVDATPRVLGSFTTDGAAAVRYSADFVCADDPGDFVAQINWNNGQYYYHRVACGSSPVAFTEAIPIPTGASAGDVYVSVVDTPRATLTRLSVETH